MPRMNPTAPLLPLAGRRQLLTLATTSAAMLVAGCQLLPARHGAAGLNRVRFTAPVPVGSRLRAHLTLQAIEPIEHGGRQMTWLVSVEREGVAKPVCVAESLVRRYP